MNNYLVHYGIKGQQWGTRRWQYEDGSYTPAGEEHYRKQKKLNVTADTKDEDIIRNVLGDEFDNVQKQVIAMQNGTHRDLTEDEIKQILGDNYETIQKEIKAHAEARAKLRKGSDSKKTTKKSSKKKKNNKIEHGVITGENYSVRYIL